jgi:hypothetical protein
MGTPVLFTGASGVVTAFFWLLFLADEKKYLAVKGETHDINLRTQVALKRINRNQERVPRPRCENRKA